MGFWKKAKKWVGAATNPSLIGGALVGMAGDYLSAKEMRAAERETQAANERSVAATNQTNAEIAQKNIDMQMEFAKNGVRWKVEDAQSMGIHPVYAMGAQGQGFSPVHQIVETPMRSASTARANMMSNMGQNISRAVQSTQTRSERMRDMLTIDNMRLQNKLLEQQLIQNQPVGPAMPSNSNMPLLTGQGNGYPTAQPYVQEIPVQKRHTQPGRIGQEVGAVDDYGFVRTSSGGLAVIPSTDVKERIEDQIIPETLWAYRNIVRPALSGVPPPSKKYYPLPPGQDWAWIPWKQEFQPRRTGYKWAPWDRK